MTKYFGKLEADRPQSPINMHLDDMWVVDGTTVRLSEGARPHEIKIVDTIRNVTMKVRDQKTGELSDPTYEWIRQKYKEGQAWPAGRPKTVEQQQGRYTLADPFTEKKAVALHSLACRALDAGVKCTDRDAMVWLATNFGALPTDKDIRRPSGCTLRRKMAKLKKSGRQLTTLVSVAGRQKGQSPLDPYADALVLEAALYYWSYPNAQQTDAYTWLETKVAQFNTDHPERDPISVPTKETLRKRIHRLRCFETVAKRYGENEAKKQFSGSGEPLLVHDILDIVLMDATTLEQVIAMDDDWQLPACKVRVVALMDLKSHAVLACHVYAGPNRAETSIEAILQAMTPPDVPPDLLLHFPSLAWLFGKPAAILPDNEKALIGPGTVESLAHAGIDVLPAKIEHPQAKAALERFFRTLKQRLAKLPSTIIDPKRAKSMDWDIIGSNCITLQQLRTVVAQVVAEINTMPSKALDGQSALQRWDYFAAKNPRKAFHNLSEVRRVLGRNGTGLLTRDGIEVNGVRYRDRVRDPNGSVVRRLLNNLAHSEPVRGRRKDGSITIEAKYRISPGNIDTIQIYDSVDQDWVTLNSTQPDYTYNLSEWEHQEFRKQAKARNEAFSTQEQRLASKERTLRVIEEMLPKLAFQQRRTLAALYVNDTVKKLSGTAQALGPIALDSPEEVSEQATFEAGDKRGRNQPAPKSSDNVQIPNADQIDGDIDFDSIELDLTSLRELGISAEEPLDLPFDAGDAA